MNLFALQFWRYLTVMPVACKLIHVYLQGNGDPCYFDHGIEFCF